MNTLQGIMQACGAYRFGVARVAPVDVQWKLTYEQWLENGMHAGMEYMERYTDVRNDPALLLPGAQSLIVAAFPYFHKSSRQNPAIAPYALGDDYHLVLRQRLNDAASKIESMFDCHTRVCIDTAPLRERYWAQACGVGTIGRNGHLIVPGAGSYFFIGTIVTDAELVPTPPLGQDQCIGCDKCVKACPGSAIGENGRVDARRCLSYLTIEHRGELPEGTLHGCLYGCDICARVCPLNANPPEGLPEFKPRPSLLKLTPHSAASLTQEEFSILFRKSAIKRAKLAGIVRNARRLLGK